MEPNQEQLLTIIDRAIDLYQIVQPIKGMLPAPRVVQSLLTICGLKVELSRIQTNLEIVIDLRAGKE